MFSAERLIGYGYDRFGNLGSIADSISGTVSSSVDETTNRLTDVTYDVAGNQLEMAGITVAFDPLNMPVQMDQATGVNKRFVYTADNERLITLDLAHAGGRRDTWTVRGLDHQVLQTWTWQEDDGWMARKDYLRRPDGTAVATFEDSDESGQRDPLPLR